MINHVTLRVSNLKRSKNFKVDSKGVELTVGQEVKIVETKPTAKDKHFKIRIDANV